MIALQILMLLISLAFSVDAIPYDDDNNRLNTTLYAQLFPSPDRFDRFIDSVFAKLDQDRWGNANISTILQNSKLLLNQDPMIQKDLMNSLRQVDCNNDQLLNKQELSTALRNETQHIHLDIEPDLCRQVSKILDECQFGSFPAFKNVSALVRNRDARLFMKACRSGINSLNHYQTEHCILRVSAGDVVSNSTSPSPNEKDKDKCWKMKQCLNEYYGYSEVQSKSNDVREIVNRMFVTLLTGQFFALIVTLIGLPGLMYLGALAYVAVMVCFGISFASLVNLFQQTRTPSTQLQLDRFR